MKKLSTILVIVIVLLTLTACGNKPEKTATAFLSAVQAKDFEKAKEYTTDEGKELLTMAATMTASMDEQEDENITFNIIETVVEGDSAVVKYEEIDGDNPDSKKEQELQMVKVDGDWKVALSKENAEK